MKGRTVKRTRKVHVDPVATLHLATQLEYHLKQLGLCVKRFAVRAADFFFVRMKKKRRLQIAHQAANGYSQTRRTAWPRIPEFLRLYVEHLSAKKLVPTPSR
jgi:hypothetical protein